MIQNDQHELSFDAQDIQMSDEDFSKGIILNPPLDSFYIIEEVEETDMYIRRKLKRFIRKTKAKYLYTCKYPGCKRKFNSLGKIQDHFKVHDKFRPFKWEYCSKSYTQKGNMIKHLRSHRIGNLEERRDFTCEFCHKGYTEKYNLKVIFFSRNFLISLNRLIKRNFIQLSMKERFLGQKEPVINNLYKIYFHIYL